ncbi:hypothetical protein ThvES_00004210 [Thiovulum sp. ES]|nr:hypothetical protein ThvES_00004210 [Thiovulum sp. ES]
MAITLTLEDEIDISRGDLIVKDSMPTISNSLKAMVVWMGEIPMQLNEKYLIKTTNFISNGKFKSIKFKKDINTFEEIQTKSLELNDIAEISFSLDREIAFDKYSENRDLGSFIIIDRYTNRTVGAGMILEVEEKTFAKEYSEAEKDLNKYIRKYYPEWGCIEI